MREGLAIARILADPTFDVGEARSAEVAAAGLLDTRYRWQFPRSTVDRPDEVSGRQIHVVYLVPSDAADESLDVNGVLEDSMRATNAWVRAETGDLEWRLDTYTFSWDDPETIEEDPIDIEAVDVSYIKSTKPGSQLNGVSEVESELVAKGFDVSSKRYFVYSAANAGGVCGDAWWNFSPTPDNFDGQYSAVYLGSSPGCRAKEFAPDATTPSYTEAIVAQEILHNDGQVTLVAPHNCASSGSLGHVCTNPLWISQDLDPESYDVLFPFVGRPLSEKHLDEDHLDYFRHPFPWRDLETSVYFRSV